MNGFYVATVVAAFVTVSLAMNLLVVGMRGSAMSGFRLRPDLRRTRRWLRRAVDVVVAAMPFRRDRQGMLSSGREQVGRSAPDGGMQ